MKMKELPPDAAALCDRLKAPPRLRAHLECVHDAAAIIVAKLRKVAPALDFDAEAVLFGAATHDLGKVAFPGEVDGPGVRHESVGPHLLAEMGVPRHMARFAGTHGASAKLGGIEDLLVAMADATWKGQRRDELEDELALRLVAELKIEPWRAAQIVGDLAEAAGERAAERMEWQRA
jgi:hypothetical protein